MAEKPEKPRVPKCAFDKTRICNGECVAFFLIQSATGVQFGCKRLR